MGGAGTGSAECRKHWTTALIPRSSGQGAHLPNAERAQATRAAWSGDKTARSATTEQRRSKTGIASLPHVKLAPMSAPGPPGERQEHLDAIIAFTSAGQKRRLFRIFDIIKVKWATRDVPEECRFSLSTQLMFLEKEKDPTTKIFDDDEWVRSLTDAQEIAADIPEDRRTHDQSEADPEKVRPIQMKEFSAKISFQTTLGSEGEIAALTTARRQLGVVSQGRAEASAIFHQLIFDEWTSEHWTRRWPESKWAKKPCLAH